MQSASLDVKNFSCKICYFDFERKEVISPSIDQIKATLIRLQTEPESVKFSTNFHKFSVTENDSIDYRMQFQGGSDKFIITVLKNLSMFAAPNFDQILGERGVIDVVGDDWSSARVCTSFDLATDIALEFCINGQLLHPEIWTICD